ncbi:hypothetical protein HPB49_003770 [Dermacentor silvarum]|uniref:Uncharacterized protein n=1 Tax=Dermacentor silvarum TaxID=543639 RepID=A0ACB8DHW4_DERSI|nr:hypothetical protein HPB49_003770 [Dermacentor silvarum]
MGRSIGDKADDQDRERVIGEAVDCVLKHAPRKNSGTAPLKKVVACLKKDALQVIQADKEDRHCSRAAMSSRGKYRAKTLKEKVEILREVDAGKQSKNEIAKKHDIPRSTLSTYIRNKKTIEDLYAAETFAKDWKRIRTAKHPDLEAALLAWIKEKRSQDIPLSGPIIVAKAADFALRLNVSDFAASDGTLKTM